ncbi:MAG: alpha/beta hydrolase-fold protein [Pirellulaceae bacterium]|nr:alpha/beta hydrolase-fold protein [Pirellulaceae bacterium]
MRTPFITSCLVCLTSLLVMISLWAWPSGAQTDLLAQTVPPPAEPRRDVEWVTRQAQDPRVQFRTFDSAAAKGQVSYHLYTPAAYDREPQRRFPVVYWLHGSGGGLSGIPPLAAHFDAAIEAGKTPPFLVVFVNGLINGMYVDWRDGSVPLETVIIKELVPHIDTTFRTIASREGRMLDGFSLGGYGAARLGFKHPELFRAVSMLGAGPLQPELTQTPRVGARGRDEILQRVFGGDEAYFRSQSPWQIAEQHAQAVAAGTLVRQVIGDRDETVGFNRDFHEHLMHLKIPHTYTVLPDVGHDPLKTLTALGDSNWDFYRAAFSDQPAMQPAARPEAVLTSDVNGQQRRAMILNATPGRTSRPTVLALHGGMGSADVMRTTSGFDDVARAHGFMVVYAEDADDLAYLDTLIDTLIRDYAADPTRIYMTGGSNGGMMTFVYAVARPERLAAIAPVVASMFTFEKVPPRPVPILIINGAQDEEVPLEGGMSRNPLVRRAQEAPYKPLPDVVQFWVRVNKSRAEPKVATAGTVTTTTYAAAPGGAETEFVVDSAGGHGWPGSRARRAGNVPIAAFSGAERVWTFFRDKQREPTSPTQPPKEKP